MKRVDLAAIFRLYSPLVAALGFMSGAVYGYQRELAVSFLVGGSIQLLPNMYFARQVFKYSGAADAGRIAQSVYRGEAGKFLLTAAGFALAFASLDPLSAPALFGGFGLMLICHTMRAAQFSR